jgi:hypothetical protein
MDGIKWWEEVVAFSCLILSQIGLTIFWPSYVKLRRDPFLRRSILGRIYIHRDKGMSPLRAST